MPSSALKQVLRSEEHTSELQSHSHLVCRLLLEKKHTKVRRKPSRQRWNPVRLRHLHMCRRDSLRGGYQRARLRAARFFVCGVRFFFFLNDGAPTEIYPFPLPAALPI